jgi:hypothetical protein
LLLEESGRPNLAKYLQIFSSEKAVQKIFCSRKYYKNDVQEKCQENFLEREPGEKGKERKRERKIKRKKDRDRRIEKERKKKEIKRERDVYEGEREKEKDRNIKT